jgi:hypothetical protein
MTLIINKQTDRSSELRCFPDFGRTKMNLKKLAAPVETFKIELRSGRDNQGTMALLWR